MSDKQWWEPLIKDDGKLDWLCDHEGDYSEKINELWTQFTALRGLLGRAAVAVKWGINDEYDQHAKGAAAVLLQEINAALKENGK